MTSPHTRFTVNFALCPMPARFKDLSRLALEVPSMMLTPKYLTHTVESALLRIPLPASILSYNPEVHRYVVRSGGEALAALHEFTRPGSDARLIGAEFELPDGFAEATFTQLPGWAKLRILETPLRVFQVAATASDALVASLTRRMNGSQGGTPA